MESKDRLDQLFQRSREQEPVASFAETQARFRESLNAAEGASAGNGIAKFLNLKNGLIMLSTIGVISTVTLLLLPSSPDATNEKENITTNTHSESTTIKAGNHHNVTITDTTQINVNEGVIVSDITSIEKIELLNLEGVAMNLEMPVSHPHIATEKSTKQYLDTIYAFPRLTPELIESNNKEKKRMLKALAKLGKGKYMFIPSGTFMHHDQQISVQAFHMQATEVTVLEYRTFLFDLLIQKRKDDFLKAKPTQSNWTHYNGNYYEAMKPMEDLYFSHPAYDSYPVNNVSREGAEMYCKWLTEEYRKWDKKGNDINDIRLPTNFEWVYAASTGGQYYPYPWGGPNPRNLRGCFMCNYWIKNTGIQLDSTAECGDALHPDAYTTSGYVLGNGTTTCPVNSYHPNDYGLYNMSGNLAEMVYNPQQSNVPMALGGGWLSGAEEVKINSDVDFEGITEAHLNIGFRVVISFTP